MNSKKTFGELDYYDIANNICCIDKRKRDCCKKTKWVNKWVSFCNNLSNGGEYRIIYADPLGVSYQTKIGKAIRPLFPSISKS